MVSASRSLPVPAVEDTRDVEEQRDPVHIKPEQPFPLSQFGVLLVLLLCEPITSSIIYPFIVQLINELGVTHGDKKALGYYVGLIESAFFLAQGIFVLQWGRLSDRVGRKPILLMGLVGLSASTLSFGLSKSFLGILAARSIAGILNGNVGVIKTVIAELTVGNDTNRAIAFSFIPITWISGSSIASFVGGAAQHPAERFPKLFGNSEFWKHYPYLLPCCFAASVSAIAFVSGSLLLKETLASKIHPKGERAPLLGEPHEIDDDRNANLELPPLSAILIRPVIVAIANFGSIALLEIANFALLTLFLAVPISAGGLGQPPQRIGIILGCSGLFSGIFQLVAFPPLRRFFGGKALFLYSIMAFWTSFPLFAIIHQLALRTGPGPVTDSSGAIQELSGWVWGLLVVQLAINGFRGMGFATIFMFITAASPSPKLLGSVNGLGHTFTAFIRAMGPACATSLHSFSVERGWMGGYFVYFVLSLLTGVGVWIARLLPDEPTQQQETK